MEFAQPMKFWLSLWLMFQFYYARPFFGGGARDHVQKPIPRTLYFAHKGLPTLGPDSVAGSRTLGCKRPRVTLWCSPACRFDNVGLAPANLDLPFDIGSRA